jgi:molybdenum cofactor synthesis domain-containing protein
LSPSFASAKGDLAPAAIVCFSRFPTSMSSSDDNPPPPSAQVHPMVPVPDAILAVLREAARIVVVKNNAAALPTTSESLDVYDHHESATGSSPMGPRRRVLARDVLMLPPGYPPYRASVMDGYAISTAAYIKAKDDDEDPPHPIRRRLFRVIRKVHAGDNNNDDNEDDNAHADEGASLHPPPAAYYVTTGAVVPDGCDCVVPLEDVVSVMSGPTQLPSTDDAAPTTAPTVIELIDSTDVRPGKWIRAVGFDVPPKSVVAAAGQGLDSTMVGLLRQAGLAKVDVLPLIRVGILSTGNELVDDPTWFSSNSSSAAGRIPDVNRPVLMSLYTSWNNCEIIDLGIVKDSDDIAIRHALTSAIANHKCQVIVTTGGISMGEMDRMEPVLRSLRARLHFGRLHMKPGKPTTLATLPDNNTLVFCLPGNPVSAAVCSHLLVRPCLDLLYRAPLALSKFETSMSAEDRMQRLVEEMPVLHPEVPVTLQSDVVLDAERPEYHRVQLRPNFGESGTITFEAHSTGVQQSSRLASMRNAHALVLLPQATPDQRKVAKGTSSRALLLDDSSGMFPRLRLGESHHVKQAGVDRSETRGTADDSQSSPATVTSAPRLLAVELVLVRCVKPTGAESNPPPNMSDLVRHVEQALSNGPTFSSFTVVTSRTCTYAIDDFSPETVWDEAVRGGGDTTHRHVDVQIVAYVGPLVQQLRLAKHLTTVLSKLAPALEMDARQGIASESSTVAALFDVVVGVVDAPTPSSTTSKACIGAVASPGPESPKSCRVFLLLPLQGLSGALSNVRRQIRHAVKVAQQSQ